MDFPTYIEVVARSAPADWNVEEGPLVPRPHRSTAQRLAHIHDGVSPITSPSRWRSASCTRITSPSLGRRPSPTSRRVFVCSICSSTAPSSFASPSRSWMASNACCRSRTPARPSPTRCRGESATWPGSFIRSPIQCAISTTISPTRRCAPSTSTGRCSRRVPFRARFRRQMGSAGKALADAAEPRAVASRSRLLLMHPIRKPPTPLRRGPRRSNVEVPASSRKKASLRLPSARPVPRVLGREMRRDAEFLVSSRGGSPQQWAPPCRQLTTGPRPKSSPNPRRGRARVAIPTSAAPVRSLLVARESSSDYQIGRIIV